jgi:hypothetical protein
MVLLDGMRCSLSRGFAEQIVSVSLCKLEKKIRIVHRFLHCYLRHFHS